MTSKRLRSSSSSAIAFVCEEADVGVRLMPAHLRQAGTITVGNTLASFDAAKVRGICWKPPGNAAVVTELMREVERVQGKPPMWVHCFYAGVDGMLGGLSGETINPESTVTTNGRGAFSSSLAEFAVMGMLHFNKQVPRLQANASNQTWDKFEMDVLHGKRVGFLGWGSIAQHTAKLLSAFGMEMICLRRSSAGDSSSPRAVATKQELASQADFIINTLPATEHTLDLCDADFFAHCKPSAVFINLGRGHTVDEAALVLALKQKRLRGACLDVFKKEPLPRTSELFHLATHQGDDECRVLLSNHNADNTADYIRLGWNVFETNYELFTQGEEEEGGALHLLRERGTVVDLDRGY